MPTHGCCSLPVLEGALPPLAPLLAQVAEVATRAGPTPWRGLKGMARQAPRPLSTSVPGVCSPATELCLFPPLDL